MLNNHDHSDWVTWAVMHGAPGKILPRAANWSGPALCTIVVFVNNFIQLKHHLAVIEFCCSTGVFLRCRCKDFDSYQNMFFYRWTGAPGDRWKTNGENCRKT